MRIVENNSGLWCERKTTQFRLENENSEPQMWDKHGHVRYLRMTNVNNAVTNQISKQTHAPSTGKRA